MTTAFLTCLFYYYEFNLKYTGLPNSILHHEILLIFLLFYQINAIKLNMHSILSLTVYTPSTAYLILYTK